MIDRTMGRTLFSISMHSSSEQDLLLDSHIDHYRNTCQGHLAVTETVSLVSLAGLCTAKP